MMALVALVAAGVVTSTVSAQQKPAHPVTTQTTSGTVAMAHPSTDVEVVRVDAFDCHCFDQTQQFNAAILGRVRVFVRWVAGATTTGKLRLDFYNLSTGQMEAMEQPVEALGSSAPGLHERIVEFLLNPKLVRKSTGFKATLTSTINDTAPANNMKQGPITLCGPLVL